MEFDILNKLIEMPKKADASKANKKLYVEQIGILLEEEGFSLNAIKYLKSGFTFAGAKPIAIYLQKLPLEQRTEEVSKLLASDLFRGSEKLVAFRCGMGLLAYSIEWFGDDQQLLLEMIKILPFVSKNKEKQLLKDAPKIFEKNFLDIVSDATELPGIDISALKGVHIQEFRQMMYEILNGVSSKYRGKAERIVGWLCDVFITATQTTSYSDVSKEENESVENNEDNKEKSVIVDVPEKNVVALTEKELLDAATLCCEFSSRLEATAAAWTSIQKKLDKEQKKIADLQKSLQKHEMQLDDEKKRNEQMTCELESRSMLIKDLQTQLIKAQEIIVGLEKKIEEVTAENVRMNSVISVYASDKQNAQSEQLNSIASKLKSEYKDFKDVEGEEMSIDLGENFRFQLQSVFRILAKAGIDIERR